MIWLKSFTALIWWVAGQLCRILRKDQSGTLLSVSSNFSKRNNWRECETKLIRRWLKSYGCRMWLWRKWCRHVRLVFNDRPMSNVCCKKSISHSKSFTILGKDLQGTSMISADMWTDARNNWKSYETEVQRIQGSQEFSNSNLIHPIMIHFQLTTFPRNHYKTYSYCTWYSLCILQGKSPKSRVNSLLFWDWALIHNR